MFESVIVLLIYLCILAILFYIVVWVLGTLGIVIPPRIVQILIVIAILIVILMVSRVIIPQIGSMGLPGVTSHH